MSSSGGCGAGWGAAVRDPDPRDEPLHAGCERLQAVVLERRINRELARPLARLSAERLWAERLQLTRLQAQVEALDLASEQHSPHSRLVERRAQWLDALHRRRGALADLADDRLTVLDLTARALPCQRIAQTALDEVGETIAFLEDMQLRRAVKRLKLVRDDLERLGISCRLWSREGPRAEVPPAAPALTAEFRPGFDLPQATTVAPAGDEAAELCIVVASNPATAEACQPLFRAMGQKATVIGTEPAAANLVKLSGNFLTAAAIEAMGEAVALVGKAGIDRQAYMELLTATVFNAAPYTTSGPLIAQGKFEPAAFATASYALQGHPPGTGRSREPAGADAAGKPAPRWVSAPAGCRRRASRLGGTGRTRCFRTPAPAHRKNPTHLVSPVFAIVRIALSRPYTFIMSALLILLFGTFAALRMPVDIFPSIDIPVIAVAFQYQGLPPEQMAGRIITPFERALTTTVNNIRAFRSELLYHLRHRQDLLSPLGQYSHRERAGHRDCTELAEADAGRHTVRR